MILNFLQEARIWKRHDMDTVTYHFLKKYDMFIKICIICVDYREPLITNIMWRNLIVQVREDDGVRYL